jgi:hypothetical protein
MAQVDMPKNDFNTAQGEPKKKFGKVVRGKVTLKEQNDIQKIANDFLAEDLKTVKDRIIAEYLIPMLKNGLCSIFNSAISIALWGDDRSRSSSTNYSRSRRADQPPWNIRTPGKNASESGFRSALRRRRHPKRDVRCPAQVQAGVCRRPVGHDGCLERVH